LIGSNAFRPSQHKQHQQQQQPQQQQEEEQQQQLNPEQHIEEFQSSSQQQHQQQQQQPQQYQHIDESIVRSNSNVDTNETGLYAKEMEELRQEMSKYGSISKQV
jgi:hypothetical protein